MNDVHDQVVNAAYPGHHVGGLLWLNPYDDFDSHFYNKAVFGGDVQGIKGIGGGFIVPVYGDVGGLYNDRYMGPLVDIVGSRAHYIQLDAAKSLFYYIGFHPFPAQIGVSHRSAPAGSLAHVGNDYGHFPLVDHRRSIEVHRKHIWVYIIGAWWQNIQLGTSLPLALQESRPLLIAVMTGNRIGYQFVGRQGFTVASGNQTNTSRVDYHRWELGNLEHPLVDAIFTRQKYIQLRPFLAAVAQKAGSILVVIMSAHRPGQKASRIYRLTVGGRNHTHKTLRYAGDRLQSHFKELGIDTIGSRRYIIGLGALLSFILQEYLPMLIKVVAGDGAPKYIAGRNRFTVIRFDNAYGILWNIQSRHQGYLEQASIYPVGPGRNVIDLGSFLPPVSQKSFRILIVVMTLNGSSKDPARFQRGTVNSLCQAYDILLNDDKVLFAYRI